MTLDGPNIHRRSLFHNVFNFAFWSYIVMQVEIFVGNRTSLTTNLYFIFCVSAFCAKVICLVLLFISWYIARFLFRQIAFADNNKSANARERNCTYCFQMLSVTIVFAKCCLFSELIPFTWWPQNKCLRQYIKRKYWSYNSRWLFRLQDNSNSRQPSRIERFITREKWVKGIVQC